MGKTNLISALQQIKSLVDRALKDVDETPRKGRKALRPISPVRPLGLSFSANVLAFMKRYAAGLSGPKKFTLLLAWMTKGNTSQEVASADIEKQWNKMKTVLGGKFNGAYANRAKANGWVDGPKFRIYTLCDSWKESLSDK
jgi:hypothetical protein